MPDITNRKQYEQYQADVAKFIANKGLSFLSTGCSDSLESDEYEHECEPWFSWSPCECCGCGLGGNREYLFARNEQDEIVKFTICEDCVYYVNYGRLDDTTMARVEQVGA